jgi:hypothetical protein
MNLNVVRVDLGTQQRARGKSETKNLPCASALGKEVSGYGPVIVRLLSELYVEQKVGASTIVQVYRGGTKTFLDMPVEKWVFNGKGTWNLPDFKKKYENT